MTREEAEKSVPYRKATFIKVNELLDELEQDKPMVEIDLYSVIRQKYVEREVIDKIRAEIEALEEGITSYHNNRPWIFKDEVLQIIDKYKAEREGEE